MKKIVTGIILLICLHGWSQTDTLEFTTRRAVADTLFGLLNPEIYGVALIDRSLTEDSLLNMQLWGNYSGTASAWSWLQAYSDIAVSYRDPSFMLSDSALYTRLETFQTEAIQERKEDMLVQPFGLLLHQVSKIDSTLFSIPGTFSNQQSQLKLNEMTDETGIYSKTILKSAALLELYGEHGYDRGTIVYDPNFISTSPDIVLNSVRLDLGAGFLDFSSSNPEISYAIEKDFQTAKAAVDYFVNGIPKQDTLSFYLSTVTYKYHDQEKALDRWDTGNQDFPRSGEAQLKYRIKFGCGSERKIRRPVIFAPPYRPSLQNPSFDSYYDQFNFKSLLSDLSDMGYDVIFIKETPGNRGIDHAGGILADFLTFINEQKKANYPDEDWENVVIGFSAGGQHWRYALKKLEKEHMETGTPHHHTRLYIPFDSPHWGANVPMFAQAVFKDLSSTANIWAVFTYLSLKDAASKDMLMNHILGSTITESGHDRIITPAPATEKLLVDNQLMNLFNHQFTPVNDLRRSFPTFTRNVAVSTGSNASDYVSSYNLYPGMKLYKQEAMIPAWYGGRTIKRAVYSSKYGSGWPVFDRKDLYVFLGVPVGIQRYYKTNNAYEWDMAQGGYKDEFYDKGANGVGFLDLSGIPVGAVTILASSAMSTIGPVGLFAGTEYYKSHVSFLPMVSALGINPNIWKNNHLYYNLKDQGLMYNKFGYNVGQDESDTYGYPHLAHPSDHFNITPFEAIYCDPQTYEHIKMQASIDENNNMDDVYLVHTRNFILDEVEADVVYLQNKVIGKNHVQWDPNYRYKAWYKAYDHIVFGDSVTPKTDPGPYIIEATGEITAYACNGVSLKPGFHAKAGSRFHAYIQCDGCSRPREKSGMDPLGGNSSANGEDTQLPDRFETDIPAMEKENELQVFPNPTNDLFTVIFPRAAGECFLSDINGIIVYNEKIGKETKTSYFRLAKGVYFLKWIEGTEIITKKIIVL